MSDSVTCRCSFIKGGHGSDCQRIGIDKGIWRKFIFSVIDLRTGLLILILRQNSVAECLDYAMGNKKGLKEYSKNHKKWRLKFNEIRFAV